MLSSNAWVLLYLLCIHFLFIGSLKFYYTYFTRQYFVKLRLASIKENDFFIIFSKQHYNVKWLRLRNLVIYSHAYRFCPCKYFTILVVPIYFSSIVILSIKGNDLIFVLLRYNVKLYRVTILLICSLASSDLQIVWNFLQYSLKKKMCPQSLFAFK